MQVRAHLDEPRVQPSSCSLLMNSFLDLPPHLIAFNPRGVAKFRGAAASLILTHKRRAFPTNYCTVNDLRTASRTPFTKPPDSSEENFFASSTASFSITLGGVS